MSDETDFEEALKNIDVFCRVLAKKLAEADRDDIKVEPIENLLRKKSEVEKYEESDLSRTLIPLPHLEEPLVDVVEDESYVKVLIQCRCEEQKVTVNPHADGLEVCTDRCQKIALPATRLKVNDMIARCYRNKVLEIVIPKSL